MKFYAHTAETEVKEHDNEEHEILNDAPELLSTSESVRFQLEALP